MEVWRYGALEKRFGYRDMEMWEVCRCGAGVATRRRRGVELWRRDVGVATWSCTGMELLSRAILILLDISEEVKTSRERVAGESECLG